MARPKRKLDEQRELEGFANGVKCLDLTTDVILALALDAEANLADESYLRGLANGSRLPAKQLALARRAYPDWFVSDQASVVDLLILAQLMREKDETKRAKYFSDWRADASITYDDIKEWVTPRRKKRTPKICPNCGKEIK